MHVLMCSESCLSLCDPMDCSPPGSSVHGILQVRNTGVDCHVLLQGIFPTQGWNQRFLYLLHCRWLIYPLSHWVYYFLYLKDQETSLQVLNSLSATWPIHDKVETQTQTFGSCFQFSSHSDIASFGPGNLCGLQKPVPGAKTSARTQQSPLFIQGLFSQTSCQLSRVFLKGVLRYILFQKSLSFHRLLLIKCSFEGEKNRRLIIQMHICIHYIRLL